MGYHTVELLLARSEALADALESDAPIIVFLQPDSILSISLLAVWRLFEPAVSLLLLYPATALDPLLQMLESSCIDKLHALRRPLHSTALPINALDSEEYCLNFDLPSSIG